jgi:mannose-6-phosphate isomerase-like protein (cupin superfamily)
MTDPIEDAAPSAGPQGAFDLSTTHIHLGLGARAIPLPDFEWSAEYLDGYSRRFADDGDEGRLVTMGPVEATWDSWERHPAGEEVVLLLSGRVDLIQRLDGGERRVTLEPGQAVINPPGVWHTADVHEPGEALFITPGRGTEHEPR